MMKYLNMTKTFHPNYNSIPDEFYAITTSDF